MLIEAGASLGFCSYLDAPKTDGSSWKRIISSPATARLLAAVGWDAPRAAPRPLRGPAPPPCQGGARVARPCARRRLGRRVVEDDGGGNAPALRLRGAPGLQAPEKLDGGRPVRRPAILHYRSAPRMRHAA